MKLKLFLLLVTLLNSSNVMSGNIPLANIYDGNYMTISASDEYLDRVTYAQPDTNQFRVGALPTIDLKKVFPYFTRGSNNHFHVLPERDRNGKQIPAFLFTSKRKRRTHYYIFFQAEYNKETDTVTYKEMAI